MARRLEHRAGELRHRINIQREDKVPDDMGGQVANTTFPADGSGWRTVFANVAASIEPISGQEGLVARQIQDTITHKIVMRYQAGVTAAMRIVFGARIFNIKEVRNFDERNWKLEIRAEEGSAV